MGKFKEIAIEIQETKKIIEQPFTSEIVAEDCNCDQTLQLIDRLKELEEKYIAARSLISLYEQINKNSFQ